MIPPKTPGYRFHIPSVPSTYTEGGPLPTRLADEHPLDERVDDLLLASVFERQMQVSLMVKQAARLLYDAKRIWLNTPLMDFEHLTPLQRRQECEPLEQLVKGTDADHR